jgi:uncharacterized protein (UPF0332 family)
LSQELLVVARSLASPSHPEPDQAALARAVSTAYYALFHAFARTAADSLVGPAGTERSTTAWRQTYRALDHGAAKTACTQARRLGFPADIVVCAETFIKLLESRHDADYDPTFTTTHAEAMAAIAEAEAAIDKLTRATPKDRTAFAILLLLRRRG